MSTPSKNRTKNNHAMKTTMTNIVKNKFILPMGILALATVVCIILFSTRPTITAAPIEPPVTAIRTMPTKAESITLTVSSRGKVQPAIISETSSSIGGPVAWISPSLVEGGYLEKDEPMLKIDARDFQTALEKSQAVKKQAEAEASHAVRELQRMKDLASKKLTSDSQLQDAKRNADVTAGKLLNADADLHQAQLNLARTELRAPFNAIVEKRNIELGQTVSPGQSLATLYGADIVEVKLPLANKQLSFLTLPKTTRGALKYEEAPVVMLTGVYAGETHLWEGRLVRTEAGIDASNNTVQAIVQVLQAESIDSEGLSDMSLPVGLLVQADIAGKTVDNIIALPRHVIRKNNQVLVAAADNTLRIREVDILRLENDRVLIQGGLKVGEQICISPIQAVVEGMPIKIVNDSNS